MDHGRRREQLTGIGPAVHRGRADSLDQQLYQAVREQAGKVGLEYEDGPAY